MVDSVQTFVRAYMYLDTRFSMPYRGECHDIIIHTLQRVLGTEVGNISS